ncbi:Eco57I restriction-modification methylase domain-containing protein [Lactobacillus equicursoris]|uniref:Eco57I restriction-modification methylase domain-containing protein n=1 Tax=Lactobacillus equicursoris TaxID=420645 RepID=UPI00242DF008|nr:Eco57I restriction-modification methylase domain-containing protein [Lactobacillus equicursoris]MDD6386703.1 Eco57I restriction-modification methylase domain-containing protein [Lactobacillus equicursoris]
MKFDYVVGNPPYQEETVRKEMTSGQKASRSIFQNFQMEVDELTSKSSVLIYPGGRWIQRAGRGMQKFGLEQINDPHLARLYFVAQAQRIFPSAGINDGISIVVKNYAKTAMKFKYDYDDNGHVKSQVRTAPGDRIMLLNPEDEEIADKIVSFVKKNNLSFLSDSVLPRNLFGIESSFAENNPDKVQLLSTVKGKIDYSRYAKVLTNDQAGSKGRSKWFLIKRNDIPRNPNLVDKWKVIVISANPGGQRRDNQLEVIDNHSAFGRSKVALKLLDTESEAENLFKYCDSKIIRFTMLLTNEALTSFAKYTPDILNYKNENPFIDFSKSIDLQLKKLLNLTDEQYEYALNRVKPHLKEMN